MYGNCKTGSRAATHQHDGHAHYQAATRFGGGYRRPKYNVPTNIVRTDVGFDIHIYALGFEKANMTITVTGDTLYVSGTRPVSEEEKPNFVRQEYPIKAFERVFLLSDAVDSTNITAKQENGVLVLNVPIKLEAQASSQTIQVE